MDSCCNKKIPMNSSERFVFKPLSKTWINGLANTYDATYFEELSQYIDKVTFRNSFSKINDDLYTYWPCPTCFFFGYCCAVCTVGLSFLCPLMCINDAKKQLDENLERMNNNIYNPRGLQLNYVSMCCTSFLEIKIIKDLNKNTENQVLNSGSIKNTNRNNKYDNQISNNQLQ